MTDSQKRIHVKPGNITGDKDSQSARGVSPPLSDIDLHLLEKTIWLASSCLHSKYLLDKSAERDALVANPSPGQGRAVAGAAEFGQISPENFSDLRLQYGQLRLRENSLFCRTKCGIKACCGDWWLLAHSWSLRGKVLSDVFKCYSVTHCDTLWTV